MAGSVFLTAIVVGVIIVALGANPFTLIPVVLIAVGALIFIPIMRKAAAETSIAQPDAPPSGTATTQDASYDPTGPRR